LTWFVSCNSNDNTNKSGKSSLKITVEVLPEGDSSYSISWKDTVGQSKGYKINNRPFEVWCVLKDTKDTVGYYKGLSTPADFTYFSTTDFLITAIFMIGPNFFSDIIADERKMFYEGNKKIIEFNPITLDIKNDLRKTLEFILIEK
jgi:hypothetical protein